MIAAFAARPSVCAGETLELRISSDRPCRVRFVRAGRLIETMSEHRGTPITASQSDPGEPGTPWSWPSYSFEIPVEWRSGAYTAVVEPDLPMRARKLDAREGRALFVVRSSVPNAAILYNVPIFTYSAYNVAHDTESERTCLYNDAPSVTIARPGCGNGGHTWDENIVDVYDPESPRQTFAHWDQPAIRWLETHFDDVDYCCDLDVHEDQHALVGYRLLLGFGHHEYWTDSMRNALRAHLRNGANAAFFSGNTCWFRIHYDADRMSISRLGRWIDDPEERTFGVSYRYGAGKWRFGRPPSGFQTVNSHHWIFDGCNVDDGDVFGDEERLIGYECDGAPDEPSIDFDLLAQARVDHWPVSDGSGEINAGRASMGIAHDRGLLFAGGTVDWARVLAAGEPIVDRITHNVIRRLIVS